jgi:hypothetical protein
VNNLISLQLAGLELRLSELVHPDWLSMSGVKRVDPAREVNNPITFSAELSRHLISIHKLAPLEYEMFRNDWTYAVLGGHHAVRAISSKLTTYLIATWVQRLIGGVQVRALYAQLGKEVYEQALCHQQPLQYFRLPKETPHNLIQYLKEEAQSLLDALWCRETPKLSPWAALMSAPRHRVFDDTLIYSHQEYFDKKSPSPDTLNEINQRLQADLAINVAEILGNSTFKV